MRLKVLLLVILLCFVQKAVAEHEYRYWDWGQSPKRDSYHYQLLLQALQVTESSHGQFHLTRIVENLSTERARREINLGNKVNVRAGPFIPSWVDTQGVEKNRPVKVPILFNLLGYQRLITLRDNIDSLEQIQNVAQLKQFQVGLGRGWIDVDIYRHNGIRVNDVAHVTTLLSMLEQGRFDFLPATLMDYAETLASSDSQQSLAVTSKTVVQFWFPVVFYVSDNNAHMADRIQAGLEVLQREGAMQRLFLEHFAAEIQYLKSKDIRFIRLENPYQDAGLRINPIPSLKGD